MAYQNVFEEEMVKLAEEMSLLEECDLTWNSNNLDETKERLRAYEDIVDEHLGLREREYVEEDDGAPISDSQLKALFFGQSEDDFSPPSRSGRRGTSSRRTSEHNMSRNSTRGGEQKIKDTVNTICRSLRWYQTKIVNEIETTSEDRKLASLLELNDRVANVLTKADWLAQSEAAQDHTLSTMSFQDATASIHAASAHIDTGDMPFASCINNAIYAVRRGGNKEDISTAVEDLIQLGNFTGTVSLPTVKQMTAAGALQALLSTLSRASDWPDVELQISKVISVLVTHEDDWALLQRSAMVILTSLYTLELKTQTRARSISTAGDSAVANAAAQAATAAQASTATNAATASATVPPNSADIRCLVAAAVAKLSLVLASDWSVQSFPFGDLNTAQLLPAGNNSIKGIAAKPSVRYRQQLQGNQAANATTEATRTLDVLLNLIITMCEGSLASLIRDLPVLQVQAQSAGKPNSLNRQTSRDYDDLAQRNMPRNAMTQEDMEAFLLDYVGVGIDAFSVSPNPFNLNVQPLIPQRSTSTSSESSSSFPRCPIDRSAILCSSALATLAEVPQCRPGLVTGGALRVLRAWLDTGAAVLGYLRPLCAMAVRKDLVMEAFTPVLEVLANTASAVMFLSGGQDGRYLSPPVTKDYMVGWIDAQVLSEGLPEAIVRLLLTAHEDMPAVPAITPVQTVGPLSLQLPSPVAVHQLAPGPIFPVVMSMYLSQTLYQLSSRPQNRTRLLTSVPAVLVMVFETLASTLREVMGDDDDEAVAEVTSSGELDMELDPPMLKPEPQTPRRQSVARAIFEYGLGGEVGPLSPTHGNNTPSPLPGPPDSKRGVSTPHTPTVNRLSSMSGRDSEDFFPSALHSGARASASYRNISAGQHSDAPSAFAAVISSTTSSCLDALTFYLEDEGALHPSTSTASLSLSVQPGPLSTPTALITLLTRPLLISALSLATSYLPPGTGRLSAVRCISTLTESTTALTALYEGNVMDVLVWIAAEAQTTAKAVPRGEIKKGADSSLLHLLGSAAGSVQGSAAKLSLNRDTSGASTVSGISSSRASYTSSSWYPAPLTTTSSTTSHTHHDEGQRQRPSSAYALQAQLAAEETLSVTYALGNLCEASPAYALRMYSSGLFTIMTRLAWLDSEIASQALRCLQAMCGSLTSPVEEAVLLVALDVLTTHILSALVPLAKAAMCTIGCMVTLSSRIRDAVMDDCLRIIVSILVNPANDRGLRGAAEEVLRNLGFSRGLKDFEICGFDVEILRDWYAIQRSLGPQIEAFSMLDHWATRLFHLGSGGTVEAEEVENFEEVQVSAGSSGKVAGADASSPAPAQQNRTPEEVDLLTNRLRTPEEVHRLLNEVANILHTEVPRGDRPAYLHPAEPPTPSSPLATLSGSLGMALPHLQRHLTDSFLKYLPFCGGNKMNDSSTHSASSKDEGLRGAPHTSMSMSRGGGHATHTNASSGVATPGTPSTVFHHPLDNYSWIDRVPPPAAYLLDVFYASKMHQLLLTDLIVLGYPEALPHPLHVMAVRLPSRSYHSFSRVGRVLGRLLEGTKVPWALSFSSSDFQGDFHTSLLSTLQRIPALTAVSFVGNKRVEEDALLGHLIGSIPSSVRWVTCRSVLSKQSVQALCLLLITHNEAFCGQSASGGLVGLALTHQGFESEEIDHVLQLLAPRSSKGVGNSGRSTPSTSNKGPGTSDKSPHTSAHLSLSPLKGLKYLDLSHNRLSDSQCATILLTALRGPLEGLELGGNWIYRAVRFIDAIESLANFSVLPADSNSPRSSLGLKYLGLSQNNLTHRAVTSILLKLIPCVCLTSLDLSANNIECNASNNDTIRNFLRKNGHLKVLDFSYNRLTSESVKEIDLGLLENDSLLCLPLAGNNAMDYSKTVELIQRKLRENRIRYAMQARGGINGTAMAAGAADVALPIAQAIALEGALAKVVAGNAAEGGEAMPSTSSAVQAAAVALRPHTPEDNADAKGSAHYVAGAEAKEAREDTPTVVAPPSQTLVAPAPLRRAISTSASTSWFSPNTLHVMFSVPLAGFDRNGKAHPLEVLDSNSERDSIIQVLKEVHRDVCLHIDYATTERLRTLLSFGCRALHYSGHGLPNGLCFEDGRGGLQVIKVNQLRDLLGAGGMELQFVFVSACYSKEIGQAFVKAGVRHVVCVKVDDKIQDAAAIAFTRAFYVALLSGKSVKASFAIATQALKASPYVPNSVLEGEKFVLLPEPEVPAAGPAESGSTATARAILPDTGLHDATIFTAKAVSAWPLPGQCTIGPGRCDVNAFLSRNHLPSPPADFEGREVVMNTLIRHILDRRLVSLVGEDGMGKSAVAAAVCKYLHDREMPGEIVFIRAKGVRDFPSFLSAMKSSLIKYGSPAVAEKLSESRLAQSSESKSGLSGVIYEEESLISCLGASKMLLVLDNLDELLADYGDNVTDMRLFLSRLFDQCPALKVLHVSVDTLSMKNITLNGIVEYSVHLGPLSLPSTLRLFARLTPALSTAQEKNAFIDCLQPRVHAPVPQLLKLFGDGSPSRIVHLACESTPEVVDLLKATGMRVLARSQPAVSAEHPHTHHGHHGGVGGAV